ncbi:unnamed protein product [Moneuplotes crassus]|uniref:Uncharacterized protein n=1 Tax=Euplotes crassus TaxID=5936 RepID=A0AAD1Y576_EUPCR|nr:unnamed protein product [Moneuplotes crassus]
MPMVDKINTFNNVRIDPDESCQVELEAESTIFFNDTCSGIKHFEEKNLHGITRFQHDERPKKERLKKHCKMTSNKLSSIYLKENNQRSSAKKKMHSPVAIKVSTPYLSALNSQNQLSSARKNSILSDMRVEQRTLESSLHKQINSGRACNELSKKQRDKRLSHQINQCSKFISQDLSQRDFINSNAQKENICIKDVIEKYSPPEVKATVEKTPRSDSGERSNSHNFSNSGIEEKKVITMNMNKYSNLKYNKPGKKNQERMETSSGGFAQADQDYFKTFEEYEAEENFEPDEETVEEFERPNKAKIGDAKKKKMYKKYDGTKLGQAFNINFLPDNEKKFKNEVKFDKPHNYPHGFTKGEDALLKVQKFEAQDRYRNISQEREVTQRMNRHNSQENIMSSSLKQKLSRTNFSKNATARKQENSGSISQRRYNVCSFIKDPEQQLEQKPKKMKKEAFDKIYRRFMKDKKSVDLKLEEKRKLLKIAQENEIRELEKARKKVGSKAQVENYIQKVQDDIQTRLFKAEKMMHKKSMDEQREQKDWFKPHTNGHKNQQEGSIRTVHAFHSQTPFDENLPSLEKSKEFKNTDYEMFQVPESNRLQEINEDFEKLRLKKEKLQKATQELLNPKFPKSESLKQNIPEMTQAYGRNSDYCGTTLVTSHETYAGNKKKIRKKTNHSTMNGTTSKQSFLCLSGSKSKKKMLRSPDAKPGENLHSIWADYIREKQDPSMIQSQT